MDITLEHFDLVGGSDKFLEECGGDPRKTVTNIFDQRYANAVKVSLVYIVRPFPKLIFCCIVVLGSERYDQFKHRDEKVGDRCYQR